MSVIKKEDLTKEMVIDKYYELHSVQAVAKHYKKRLSTIRNILRDNGIDTTKKNKYKVNPNTNEKICTKCLLSKSMDSFYFFEKENRYVSMCYECSNKQISERRKFRYHNEPDYKIKIRELSKKYVNNNRDKKNKYHSEWRKNNRDKVNKTLRNYYHNNKEYYKEINKKKHRKKWDNDPNHREKINRASKERFKRLYYSDDNYKKNRINKAMEYHKIRYNNDELYKFKSDIRKMIGNSFARMGYSKNSKTQQILGESWEVVKQYIESQFTDGMTWDNYGEWVYDHKVPLSIAKTDEEILKLNHYTNFQPLWFKDNLEKSNKILPEHEHLIVEYLGDIRNV